MSTTSSTIITRPGGPAVSYYVMATSMEDIKEAIASELSSPITSYDATLQHHRSYSVRLRAAKVMTNDLAKDVKDLKDAEAQRKEDDKQRKEAEAERLKIYIDWEIRSRVAQGLNDSYRHLIPANSYSLLKDAGYGYLPYLLTIWALERDSNLLADTSQVVRDQYSKRIATLKHRGLTKHVNSAWDSVPYEGRKLMIHMWTTRPATRLDFAHSIPTAVEAQDLVQSDPLLTPVGRVLALTLIPNAVNNQGDPLFLSSV